MTGPLRLSRLCDSTDNPSRGIAEVATAAKAANPANRWALRNLSLSQQQSHAGKERAAFR